MASVIFENVSVSFSMFDAVGRSLKRKLLPFYNGPNGQPAVIQALDGLSVRLDGGTRLAVMGNNGSGKTTFLRVAAGLLAPQAGLVKIDGPVGSVFSFGFGLHPEASLRELAQGQALLAGCPFADSAEKASEILDFAEIKSQEARLQAALAPSGLVKRLGIASAFCLGAQILVLDEVLETLSPDFLAKVQSTLEGAGGEKTILLLAERARSILEQFCSDAIILDDGKLAAWDSLPLILSRQGKAMSF